MFGRNLTGISFRQLPHPEFLGKLRVSFFMRNKLVTMLCDLELCGTLKNVVTLT